MHTVQLLTIPLLAISTVLATAAIPENLKVEYTLSHTCKRPSRNGDTINAHYRGTLAADGKEFDASYNRGQPLAFQLGAGRVIKGWDLGLLDMCPGDKRKLTIPPELGYGNRGMGPIPAGSTLVFETELVSIVGVDPEEKVVKPKEAEEGKAGTGATETEPEAPVQEENPQEEAEKEQKARQEL